MEGENGRGPMESSRRKVNLGCWGKDTESAAIFIPCFASGGGLGEEEIRTGGDGAPRTVSPAFACRLS